MCRRLQQLRSRLDASSRALPPDELSVYYPGTYHAYALERGLAAAIQKVGQRITVGHHPLDTLAKRSPGSLLDVGCGRGDLGAAFLRLGWRVAGVEPSASACSIARGRGVDARTGTLGSLDHEDESFDAVVMNHSLEHVPDPRGDLARVYRLLRRNGLLIISLPNFASWHRKRFGSAWFHLDLPRHRTHFTPESLRGVLTATGFEIVSLQANSDSGSLFASLQYVYLGKLLFAQGPAAWLTYAIHGLVSPLNRLLDHAQGPGPLLHVVARRPS